MIPKLISGPDLVDGDPNWHVYQVAFYATEADAIAGTNPVLIDWVKTNALRNTATVVVVDGQGVKISEQVVALDPVAEIKKQLEWYLQQPSARVWRGDLRDSKHPEYSAPPPTRNIAHANRMDNKAGIVALKASPMTDVAATVAAKLAAVETDVRPDTLLGGR